MIDRVDGAHVVAMPVLFLPPVGLAHAERSAQQRALDIVHAQRVSRQQCAAPIRRESTPPSPRRRRCAPPPVPPPSRFSCPSARACSISVAVWRTAVSSCRSDETPLLMNANASRSRSFDSGTTRMPRMPTTTRSPWRRSRSLRQTARPSSTTIIASMRWFSTSTHLPACRTSVRWLVVE